MILRDGEDYTIKLWNTRLIHGLGAKRTGTITRKAIAGAAAALKVRQKAAAKTAAINKKTTITCVKSKLTKKVTAVKPKCPTGYKVKK